MVSASCPNVRNPKLVERVARAMCKADGNDPDAKCLRSGSALAHLSGIAAAAQLAPRDCSLWPAWMLYAYAAEVAISELEAAAMEPFTLRPGTATADPVEPPVERTPWFPPETVRNAWATEVRHCGPFAGKGDLAARICGLKSDFIVVDDPMEDGGAAGVKRLAGKVAEYEADQDGFFAKLREDTEKMAADILSSSVFADAAPAPKDAVLIEALRKQREKEGW